MSQELQVQSNYTPEQIKLIRDTVARNATEAEFELFLYRCKALGFNPLKPGQIHFVKYGNNPGTIIIGVDGFRSRAMRSGKLSGIKRGIIRDESAKCIAAWAEVYRNDWQHPAREEVAMSEYNAGKGMWLKLPETMLKKVAEVAALRMAFPDDLGGLYSDEEMDQAKNHPPSITPEQPSEQDGSSPNRVRIRFGKLAGRHPSEVDRKELEDYYFFLEEKCRTDAKYTNDVRATETRDIIGEYLDGTESEVELPQGDK